MNKESIRHVWQRTSLGGLAFSFLFATSSSDANPQGMTVLSGSAHATQQGNVLQITTTSRNTVLGWNSFNIGAGQTTIFDEPSASSIVFNNIHSGNPSSIFGSLQANGIVVLENQSGFFFGPNAFVKAAGLVVTTAAIDPWGSGSGAGWSFDGPPAATPIVNYGHLVTAAGGSLFLIARQIENQGTIEAPGGTAALIAGQEVLLSERPDGLSLSAPVQLPAGSVDNQGRIVANAGQVLLQAQTVNNSGVIQANSVRQQNGVIELYASQDIQLSGSSVIQANGDGTGSSQGGNIVIKSGGSFSDSAGSQITASGGAEGGNGGNVEISAPDMLSLYSRIDAGAQLGWNEGWFSLDPQNIVLGNFSSGSTSAGTSGVISATGSSGPEVDVDVGSAFQNISANILLQASGNITLNPGITWDLSQSTGRPSGQLTMEAGGNITLGTTQVSSQIQDENHWSVSLAAGYNFPAGQGVVSGIGSVILNGASVIQMASGNISVLAGDNVMVGSGGIVTGIANGAVISGLGGNINVQAVAGSVNCGTSVAGYMFGQSGLGFTVDPLLGGISTANGGDVTIQAGGNIIGTLPSGFEDAGSGAFGAAPGNVSLTAGGNVVGHFVLTDGTGTITAGNSAGAPGENLALSLTQGGWTVNAAQDIELQEVRNPNGVFNDTGSPHSGSRNGPPSPFRFLFDYGPLDYVDLNAGDGVTITGAGLPRDAGNSEGLIFPPNLTIDAGAGGIAIDAPLNLFPSPEGTLNLTTTGGGNLYGSSQILCISDSSVAQWTTSLNFTSLDPNNNPVLHFNDPNPVLINISGSVSDFVLSSPKAVEMTVGQNLIDSSATILHLHPTDVTSFSVGGEILDHSSFVLVTLPTGVLPNFAALDNVSEEFIAGPGNELVPNPNWNPLLGGQQAQFSYDAATGGLRYSGFMSSAVENALLSMTVPFLPASVIEQIYAQSQLETISPGQAYAVAGPGTFRINAGSIDLGNSSGIVSLGISGYQALVPYTARGADIDVTTSGNLSMVASTIESDYGGNIHVNCGGQIDVGSVLVPPSSDQIILGIVSLWGGNISVVANQNINVDGSRIATYDGGDIFVESLFGSVDAGTGGGQPVLVQKVYVNQQGQLEYDKDLIPGSGILATSYPELVYGETSSEIGNITVETPQGNIVASQGGIVQLALGSGAKNDATITLDAGSPGFVGNVDAAGSGVIGGQVNINATGSIEGLVVASVGADVTALQNISATVLSQGGATVSAGGTVSGTIVGVGSVSVTGASDVAAAFAGGGVTTSGSVSGAAVTAAPVASNSGATAATAQQVTQSTQANSDLASNDAEDDLKKRKKQPLLQYAGRVTVLLPGK
jgi:filamentous hemagglutinin family protein